MDSVPTTPEVMSSPLKLSQSLLPVPLHHNPHTFTLPPNTAGQAKIKKPAANILPKPNPLSTPFQQQSPIPFPIPYSTKSYRKRKEQQEQAGEKPKRYKPITAPSKCSKCGKPRTDGHKQYFGNWYCPHSSQSYEQWREKFADKYKKEKKN